MHRSCIHPDCDIAFDECRIHHIIPWEHGGTTDLANLAPLCESRKHHHDVHEGGWTLTMHFEWVGEARDQIAYPSRYCPNNVGGAPQSNGPSNSVTAEMGLDVLISGLDNGTGA